MNVGGNYAQPVYVNGYQCNNCTDVEYAKKHIDPAHPQSGPYGIHADTDSTQHHKPSVTFGGALSDLNDPNNTTAPRRASHAAAANASAPGRVLDLSA